MLHMTTPARPAADRLVAGPDAHRFWLSAARRSAGHPLNATINVSHTHPDAARHLAIVVEMNVRDFHETNAAQFYSVRPARAFLRRGETVTLKCAFVCMIIIQRVANAWICSDSLSEERVTACAQLRATLTLLPHAPWRPAVFIRREFHDQFLCVAPLISNQRPLMIRTVAVTEASAAAAAGLTNTELQNPMQAMVRLHSLRCFFK